MMTLYHGSNVAVASIDLSLSRNGKDFGRGFYLNPVYRQALGMATRTTKRMRKGSPIVSAFNFDEENALKDLNVKIFDDYTTDWAEFIVRNRNNPYNKPAHPYDIVIGPIADDTVGLQLRRFLMGYVSISGMVEELRYRSQPTRQYMFGTERSLSYLTPTTL